jgi:Encapsulating protein for peroxidase
LTYTPPNAAPQNLPPQTQTMGVDDRTIVVLASLQARVQLRGAQVADPQLASALEMFRRAANVLARLEDAIVFLGQLGADLGPPPAAIVGLPAIWRVTSGSNNGGLFGLAGAAPPIPPPAAPAPTPGGVLVQNVSAGIGQLEGSGHYGPFAVVLGTQLFAVAQDPNTNMVLPSDRIIPFLGGGPLLRSSTLPPTDGIIVALGAAPFELVIATDVSVDFLQVTTDPHYIFRVHEKIALRVKEPFAIALL